MLKITIQIALACKLDPKEGETTKPNTKKKRKMETKTKKTTRPTSYVGEPQVKTYRVRGDP